MRLDHGSRRFRPRRLFPAGAEKGHRRAGGYHDRNIEMSDFGDMELLALDDAIERLYPDTPGIDR